MEGVEYIEHVCVRGSELLVARGTQILEVFIMCGELKVNTCFSVTTSLVYAKMRRRNTASFDQGKMSRVRRR
jgi:hypothetical protein